MDVNRTKSRTIRDHLPDIPRWVEARASLATGACEVFGDLDTTRSRFVFRDHDAGYVFVIGEPNPAAVLASIAGRGHKLEIIAELARAPAIQEILTEWSCNRAIIGTLPDENCLAPPDQAQIAWLDPADLVRIDMPADLREELGHAARYGKISASLDDGAPVSFCYAGSVTETWWDVAIDTLPAYRRKGHAARVASFMIRHMAGKHLRPVWGALEQNPASWRLACRLGFTATDELAVFERRA
jgi:RimJ/RimL family protein N-acetyltransferase